MAHLYAEVDPGGGHEAFLEALRLQCAQVPHPLLSRCDNGEGGKEVSTMLLLESQCAVNNSGL